jgi:hypothetical protein
MMKKAISLLTAAILTLIAALPAGASAAGDEVLLAAPKTVTESSGGDFNFQLATILIVTICSILTVAVVIVAVYLARKNRNN